ncbi:hypothetical protein AWN90_01410 [Nocardia terpenica]|uniref:Uncharacterized protein n=1 Tax=Nocardia terpenica TaxID=455432 RepID=A0A164KJ33_9NOCA|nr:hypothetical protein AWN90_01410 [Nocardia terpenica]
MRSEPDRHGEKMSTQPRNPISRPLTCLTVCPSDFRPQTATVSSVHIGVVELMTPADEVRIPCSAIV